MKPIIKYRGGKSKEIKNFLQFVPRDYRADASKCVRLQKF